MIAIIITVMVAELWLWYALVTDLKRRNRVLRVVVCSVRALLTLALLYLTVRILAYRGEYADPANAFRHIVLGALAALLITAGSVYLIVRLLTWLLRRITRRKLKNAGLTGIIAFLLLVALFADGFFRQRFNVRVVREEIPVAGLAPGLSGMKIVLISDLHLSSWHGHYDRLDDIMSLINAEQPDLLINTGDFISYGWQEFGECDTILRKAHASCGAFAVDGNHDDGSYHPGYGSEYSRENDERLMLKIRSSGYTLLRDTTVVVSHNGAAVAIKGITTHGHHFAMSYGNFDRVMRLVPDSLFSIMLLHDPAGWDEAALHGRLPGLTLSGHTHGMQAGLPVPEGFISPASWLHKYWKGLYSQGDRYLYVTTGLGTMGMALRIFMPPEIVVLTVTRQ